MRENIRNRVMQPFCQPREEFISKIANSELYIIVTCLMHSNYFVMSVHFILDLHEFAFTSTQIKM